MKTKMGKGFTGYSLLYFGHKSHSLLLLTLAKVLSTTLREIPTSIAKPSSSATTTSAAMEMMAAMLQTPAAGQGASKKTGFGDKDIERAEACFVACQTNFDANVNGYVNMLSDNYVRAA
jgi:hypothetical protein